MKCEKCGKKIEYNQYKKVKGKVYCLKCAEKNIAEKLFDAAKKVELDFKDFETDMNEVAKITTPTKKAEKEMGKYGITALEAADVLGIPEKKRKYKKRE